MGWFSDHFKKHQDFWQVGSFRLMSDEQYEKAYNKDYMKEAVKKYVYDSNSIDLLNKPSLISYLPQSKDRHPIMTMWDKAKKYAETEGNYTTVGLPQTRLQGFITYGSTYVAHRDVDGYPLLHFKESSVDILQYQGDDTYFLNLKKDLLGISKAMGLDVEDMRKKLLEGFGQGTWNELRNVFIHLAIAWEREPNDVVLHKKTSEVPLSNVNNFIISHLNTYTKDYYDNISGYKTYLHDFNLFDNQLIGYGIFTNLYAQGVVGRDPQRPYLKDTAFTGIGKQDDFDAGQHAKGINEGLFPVRKIRKNAIQKIPISREALRVFLRLLQMPFALNTDDGEREYLMLEVELEKVYVKERNRIPPKELNLYTEQDKINLLKVTARDDLIGIYPELLKLQNQGYAPNDSQDGVVRVNGSVVTPVELPDILKHLPYYQKVHTYSSKEKDIMEEIFAKGMRVSWIHKSTHKVYRDWVAPTLTFAALVVTLVSFGSTAAAGGSLKALAVSTLKTTAIGYAVNYVLDYAVKAGWISPEVAAIVKLVVAVTIAAKGVDWDFTKVLTAPNMMTMVNDSFNYYNKHQQMQIHEMHKKMDEESVHHKDRMDKLKAKQALLDTGVAKDAHLYLNAPSFMSRVNLFQTPEMMYSKHYNFNVIGMSHGLISNLSDGLYVPNRKLYNPVDIQQEIEDVLLII